MAEQSHAGSERRSSGDRREGLRRQEDRARFARSIGAALIAICGGLVALFVFLGVIGAFHFGQAAAASGAALALGAVWFAVFFFRLRAGGVQLAQRSDRERRGY
ncbi:MAG TPA: hypothetical protein VHE14_06125 [Solirubrobacteraceae bacterium]|nr:hypothetical protein [Solirubrobacteraceae bacterium]